MSSIVDLMILISAIEPGSMRNITGILFPSVTIALAMKPDWVAEGAKKRHIIMLWTDAATKDAGTNDEIGVPQNNGELVSWWLDPQCGKMDPHATRI